ncbi:Phosphoglycerate mutase-like protein [Glarea lozoyensis ATCC 20868]|uniref:Phosphoglycerate mutase-like protein n=1 Tax=Glarea lozoyensis (strain ATCC 20868 / MF5171) TaxID=1116229 RepID=S3D509_GLAL2|nr:Phosphoglycerate mutase-like protein [Glarea lozoyensis ATCC 20868]EPE33542.1 Phosphoglycerate mutase-like protein [Glarea lozoyensis ATCC 20868]
MSNTTTVHILRHGQALHNVDRHHREPDPPLTNLGIQQAEALNLSFLPDVVVVSPMIRTIETAYYVLRGKPCKVLIWPDLREAHDAICNKGSPRIDLINRYPDLDFSECSSVWDYEKHTSENAHLRASRVRLRLESLGKDYANILVVTHRGFIAHLVAGTTFFNCEMRSYHFISTTEYIRENENGILQDFAPHALDQEAVEQEAEL